MQKQSLKNVIQEANQQQEAQREAQAQGITLLDLARIHGWSGTVEEFIDVLNRHAELFDEQFANQLPALQQHLSNRNPETLMVMTEVVNAHLEALMSNDKTTPAENELDILDVLGAEGVAEGGDDAAGGDDLSLAELGLDESAFSEPLDEDDNDLLADLIADAAEEEQAAAEGPAAGGVEAGGDEDDLSALLDNEPAAGADAGGNDDAMASLIDEEDPLLAELASVGEGLEEGLAGFSGLAELPEEAAGGDELPMAELEEPAEPAAAGLAGPEDALGDLLGGVDSDFDDELEELISIGEEEPAAVAEGHDAEVLAALAREEEELAAALASAAAAREAMAEPAGEEPAAAEAMPEEMPEEMPEGMTELPIEAMAEELPAAEPAAAATSTRVVAEHYILFAGGEEIHRGADKGAAREALLKAVLGGVAGPLELKRITELEVVRVETREETIPFSIEVNIP